MSTISGDLQAKLDLFAQDKKRSVTPEMVANLKACIESSPALVEQMNRAVQEKHLKKFELMTESDPSAGALYDTKDKIIKIAPKALDQSFSMHDLAFVLGHETQHGFNAAECAKAIAAARQDMIGIARSKTEDSYDAPIAAWQQAGRQNEAKASLAGWNAAVGQLRNEGRDVTLESMYTTYRGRARDFVDEISKADGQTAYQLKPGITLNADLSANIDDLSNIAALGRYYYDNPLKTVGFAKSSYANYDGASILSQAIQFERHYGSERMTIDLARHGMSEPVLEKNGIDLGSKAVDRPRHAYIDTSHGQLRAGWFDHTHDARVSANQVHTHVPITPALGEVRERGFDDKNHPDHALYAELRQRLPPETSPDRLTQITLAAKMGGVQPGQITGVAVHEGAVFIRGEVPGERAKIELDTPPPQIQETLRQNDAHDREQALFRTQLHERQQQVNERAQGRAMGL